MEDDAKPTSGGVDDLYSRREDVLPRARAVLEDVRSLPAERGSALWVLGRAAYYGNRMAEAVRLLSDALPLVDDEQVLAEVLLALAPALSKEGRSHEALDVLDDRRLSGTGELAGQIHNQRGIILTELGRLPEARVETELAVELLDRIGDSSRVTRALTNLAVIASMMGDLDESERRYEEALRLTLDTGQPVVAAGIEGNRGYVASRRGDFATALDWYARARRSFEELGEVDLLAAVLEVDYARTLLDVGLAVDAVEAADRAARSATEGGNQMLELQSRLLCGEALLRLGERRSAVPEIERCAALANSLEHVASQRRVIYLAREADLDLPGVTPIDEIDEIDEVRAFIDAGWAHEAYSWMLRRAQRTRRRDPDRARAIIIEADRLTAALDVDPIARAAGAMLVEAADGDADAVGRAYGRALDALVDQQELLGSVELRASVGWNVRQVAEVAVAAALPEPDAADRVLTILERGRSIMMRPGGGGGASTDGDAARLRDARVALAEAKADSGDVAAATEVLRAVEREVLRGRRSRSATAAGYEQRRDHPVPHPPVGTSYLTHVVQEERLIGVRRDHRGTVWVDHGELDEIASVGRTQRAALRRLNDGRRKNPEADVDRLRSTSRELDERLIAPFDIGGAQRVVFTPAAQLWHLCWNALPSLDRQPLTIASTLGDWADDPEQLTVRRLAFLGGPDLAGSHAELASISEIWSRPDAARPTATAAEASEALVRTDVAHIAAHGAFRSDNVFFSSIVFADRELSLLEICDLPRVPRMVVLASCDAGASVQPSGLDEDVTVGTAKELLRMGAHVVVAPTVAVSDEAAAEFSVSLHRELVAGRSIDDAFFTTKRRMTDSADPVRMATAWSFNLMGGRSTQRPLRIGR